MGWFPESNIWARKISLMIGLRVKGKMSRNIEWVV
jgi:hypothetical protein